MEKNVVSVHESVSIKDAAKIFVKKHIGLLPVVDDEKKPIGIVSIGDLLALELPGFVSFLSDVDFVHDFGAVENTRPPLKVLNKSVKTIMKPAFTIETDCGLLLAYALMLQHNLQYLPVVSKTKKLVGIVSRVDVGAKILSTWQKAKK
ncbi:MAG: CBS domain-containing protein [Anaerolineales bacterium]|nr:CBS domain-containing protein [Anaerolineales bacterium]MBX3036273.1 CBS domain-containing protein [Anaerolineales bacterium]